jgi:quaternary ammonium compound-resistance protein SugE
MAWITLLLAGVFEIGFTTALRYVDSIARWRPIAAFMVCGGISFYLLVRASQTIPLGTAYAVWTGIGALGTAVIGIIVYGEPATALRLVFLSLLIGSIAGLKFVSTH